MKESEKCYGSSKSADFKKIMLGKQTFEFLIDNNFLYVDKTEDIYNLINNESTVFLSRPRRFGKSLLLSTLKNIFMGNKELFEGLYIYDYWDWNKSYSVLHLDMSQVSNETNELLELTLSDYINEFAKDYGIELNENLPVDFNFHVLIEDLSNKTGKKVIVLVDEYDAPILDNINNQTLADANRKTLQSFYQALKTSDKYINFVFITGISKFMHNSILSKLNSLTDITLSNEYSTICGITPDELNDYCFYYIQSLADKENISHENALAMINHWYDGYSFDGEHKVLNPFSTLSALKNGKFSQYWVYTGTPHFLVDIQKNREKNIGFEYMIMSEKDLNKIGSINIDDLPLLFQGGYLTIDSKFKNELNETEYSLRIPNFEVEQAYKSNLTDIYLKKVDKDFKVIQDDMWAWIRNGDCDILAKKLRIKFSRLPLTLRLSKKNKEKWKLYSAIFLTWLDTMGMRIDGEKSIGHGIIDTIIEENDDHIAVVEIKYSEDPNKSLDSLINESFKQIHEKEYYLPYEDSDITLIALAFKDREIKNGIITDVKCKIEKWNY
ncbi:MAG: ATP-binding protein [Methanobrevibacter sp.]|jgi:hypothetical protein|nr:ATP-binding protein [Candidatus Methanovirga meridionalis]